MCDGGRPPNEREQHSMWSVILSRSRTSHNGRMLPFLLIESIASKQEICTNCAFTELFSLFVKGFVTMHNNCTSEKSWISIHWKLHMHFSSGFAAASCSKFTYSSDYSKRLRWEEISDVLFFPKKSFKANCTWSTRQRALYTIFAWRTRIVLIEQSVCVYLRGTLGIVIKSHMV